MTRIGDLPSTLQVPYLHHVPALEETIIDIFSVAVEAEIEDAAVKALVEGGRAVGVAESSADADGDESADHGDNPSRIQRTLRSSSSAQCSLTIHRKHRDRALGLHGRQTTRVRTV
jgi:hypothetical protein